MSKLMNNEDFKAEIVGRGRVIDCNNDGSRLTNDLDGLAKLMGHRGITLHSCFLQPQGSTRIIKATFGFPGRQLQLIRTMRTCGRKLLGYRAAARSPIVQAWILAESEAEHAVEASNVELRALFDANNLSPKTVANYVVSLGRAMGILNCVSFIDLILEPVGDKATILKAHCESHGTYNQSVQAIAAAFKVNEHMSLCYKTEHTLWRQEARLAGEDERSRRLTSEPINRSQDENYVDREELRAILHTRLHTWLSGEAHATLPISMHTLLLSYLTEFPPKRCEVGEIRVFLMEPTCEEDSSSPNHIVLNGQRPRMVLRDFKTRHRYPEGIFEDLRNTRFLGILRASMERYPRDGLFVTAHAQCSMSKERFSIYVKDSLRTLVNDGRAPGVSLLRHSAVNEYYCEPSALTLTNADERDHAHRMGHDSLTARQQYRFPCKHRSMAAAREAARAQMVG